jgi:hypothetical protein
MALPLGPSQLEQQSEVSESDIVLAVALWKLYAPTTYKSLIDGSGIYKWDTAEGKYLNIRTGVFIDSIALRNAAIDPFLIRVKSAMRDLDKRLQGKVVTLTEWHLQMIAMVKQSQIAASLIAIGGVPNSSQIDRSAIASSVIAMLTFLQTFAEDIESGKQLINGTLLSRTDLYANSARDAYEEARRNAVIVGAIVISGVIATRERRILEQGANHCNTDGGLTGCIELAAKGWQPIGTLPRLYDTPCRTNCKCRFDYK